MEEDGLKGGFIFLCSGNIAGCTLIERISENLHAKDRSESKDIRPHIYHTHSGVRIEVRMQC